LGHECGEIARSERTRLVTELKSDGSIVTSADRKIEEYLREELPNLVRGTNVWGEEFGFEPEGEEGLWLVDPIDGTSNYAFGSPLWGVSIALIVLGQIQLGCIALPDLNELYISGFELGSFLNGEPMKLIPAGIVQDHELICYNESAAASIQRPIPWKRRDLGSFVVSGAFVATQRLRGLIGRNEKLYDCAAAILLCNELGADIRYANGSAFVPGDLVCDEKIEAPWLIFPAKSGVVL
jgi:fructose-1,6-bisphosphatase/inositol monophosphatase family enzyme